MKGHTRRQNNHQQRVRRVFARADAAAVAMEQKLSFLRNMAQRIQSGPSADAAAAPSPVSPTN